MLILFLNLFITAVYTTLPVTQPIPHAFPTSYQNIRVLPDFSFSSPVLLGKLYVGVIKGGETYSFEFEREWLKKTAH